MCRSGLTKNLAFVSGLGLPRTPHGPVNGCLMVPIIVGIWGIVEPPLQQKTQAKKPGEYTHPLSLDTSLYARASFYSISRFAGRPLY